MNNYIDDNYYYDTFEGKLIPQEEIDKYATLASREVRLRIFNKPISGYETQIKDTTCRVAELLYNQNLKKERIDSVVNGTEKIVTSEKVGDYSRNISAVSLADLKADYENTDKKITEEIEKELLFTGLLYSGVKNVR